MIMMWMACVSTRSSTLARTFGQTSKVAGVCTLGEVLINDTDYASQYTGEQPTAHIQPWISVTFDHVSGVLDAILDYPSYFRMRHSFLGTRGKFSTVASTLVRSQQTPRTLFRTGSFVENHDQPRLASMTKDPAVCHS